MVALVTTIDPVLAAPVTPLATPTGLAFAGAIVIALQSAIYTYDGWTGPIYFGEELRDPPRDIPRAMIGGVVLVLGDLPVAQRCVSPRGSHTGDGG